MGALAQPLTSDTQSSLLGSAPGRHGVDDFGGLGVVLVAAPGPKSGPVRAPPPPILQGLGRLDDGAVEMQQSVRVKRAHVLFLLVRGGQGK